MDSANFLSALRKNGHRITAARRAILAIVVATERPLSAKDVRAALLNSGIKADVATVYRELSFLEREGILKTITFKDGVKRFEPAAGTHHHHLVCTSCSGIQDIEMEHDLDALETHIGKEKGFTVQSHALEFYGLCSSCGSL